MDNQIIINAWVQAIKDGRMTLEQVLPIYRDEVQAKLDEVGE